MKKNQAQKKLIIDRSKWRAGGADTDDDPYNSRVGEGDTRLLNDKGYMCCLGFACKQFANAQDEHLLNQPRPIIYLQFLNGTSTLKDIGEVPYLTNTSLDGIATESLLTQRAITLNDSSLFTKAGREDRIRDLFAKHDVEVEFINDY